MYVQESTRESNGFAAAGTFWLVDNLALSLWVGGIGVTTNDVVATSKTVFPSMLPGIAGMTVAQ